MNKWMLNELNKLNEYIFFNLFVEFKVLIETQKYTEGKIIYKICLKWKQGVQIFEIFS